MPDIIEATCVPTCPGTSQHRTLIACVMKCCSSSKAKNGSSLIRSTCPPVNGESETARHDNDSETETSVTDSNQDRAFLSLVTHCSPGKGRRDCDQSTGSLRSEHRSPGR